MYRDETKNLVPLPEINAQSVFFDVSRSGNNSTQNYILEQHHSQFFILFYHATSILNVFTFLFESVTSSFRIQGSLYYPSNNGSDIEYESIYGNSVKDSLWYKYSIAINNVGKTVDDCYIPITLYGNITWDS